MQIHKFREKNLAEDYMDIHYREENAQIRGLFSYLDSMTAVVGKNDHGERLLAVSEIYYCEIVDRKCFAYLEKEVYQIDYGLQQFLDSFHSQELASTAYRDEFRSVSISYAVIAAVYYGKCYYELKKSNEILRELNGNSGS